MNDFLHRLRPTTLVAATSAILIILDLVLPDFILFTVVAVGAASAMFHGSVRWAILFVASASAHAAAAVAGVPYASIVGLALVAGSAAGLLRGHAAGVPWQTRFRPKTALVVVTILSLLSVALRPGESTTGWVAALAFLCLPAFALVLTGVSAADPWGGSVTTWLAGGLVATSAPGLTEAYRSVATNYSGYTDARVFESAIGSSNFAAAICAVTAVAVLAAGDGRVVWRVVISAPFIAAPFVFASRGAILVLLLAGLLLAFSAARSRSISWKVWLSGVATLVALVWVAVEQQWFWVERFTSNIDGLYSLTSGRDVVWSSAFDIIKEAPLLGVGPGVFSEDLAAAVGLAYPHNLVIAWLGQVGVLGAVVLIATLSPRPFHLRASSAAPLVAMLAASMLEPFGETPLGAVMIACALASHHHSGVTEAS